MAFKAGDAVVYLNADDSELKSGLDEGRKKIDGWGSAVSGLLAGVGFAAFNAIAGAAQSAVGYLGDAISAASDMGETISKTGVLFGDAADELVSWSEKSALGFGQSKQQALDAATTFATFGKAAGLVGKDLVSFSTDFTELASDLASFNNTSPEQAIDAIGAALRGESEPLRAYGVLLDDASMRQKALELGIISTTKEALTPQQKVLAAQALIYEQTSAAQGDFARTSGGLANQQRILDAQWTNMQATLGEGLLPVQLAFTGAMSELLQVVLPPLVSFITGSVVPAMTAFGDVVGSLIRYFVAVIEDGDTWNDWLSHLPAPLQNVAFFIAEVFIPAIKSIGEALTSLFGYFVETASTGDVLNTSLLKLPTALQPFALAIGSIIQPLTSFTDTVFTLLQYLSGAPDTYSTNSTALSRLPGPLQTIAVTIKEVAIPAFSQLIDTMATFYKSIAASLEYGTELNGWLDELPEPLKAVSLFITETLVPAFVSIGETITNILTPVLQTLGPLFNQFGRHLSNVVDQNFVYFKKWFDENLPRIQLLVERITSAIKGIWSGHGTDLQLWAITFFNLFVSFWDTQFKTILDIVTVALQLLTGDFEGAGQTIRGIVERWRVFLESSFRTIVAFIKDIFKTVNWENVGRSVVNGIWDGMKSAWNGVKNWFSDRLQELRNQLPFSEPKDPDSPLRGLGKSGSAIVEMLQDGINSAGQLVAPSLNTQGALVGASNSNTYNVTVNLNGGSVQDGLAVRDGVMSAFRAMGV